MVSQILKNVSSGLILVIVLLFEIVADFQVFFVFVLVVTLAVFVLVLVYNLNATKLTVCVCAQV